MIPLMRTRHFFPFFCYILIGCLIILLLIFSNCTERSQKSIIFKPNNQIDSVYILRWLGEPDHYFDSTYHKRFLSAYNNYIEKGQIDSAACVLNIAGQNAIANYRGDTLILNSSLNFIKYYRDKIGPIDLAGIACNIGSTFAAAGNYSKSNNYLHGIHLIPYDYESTLIMIRSRVELLYNYLYTGNADSALAFGFDAARYNQLIDDPIVTAGTLSGLAGVYLYTGDVDKALILLDVSINRLSTTTDTVAIYMMMTNKTGIMYQTKHPKLISQIHKQIDFYEAWQPVNPKFKLDALSWKAIGMIKEGRTWDAEIVLKQIDSIKGDVLNSEFQYSVYDIALNEINEVKNQSSVYKEEYLKMIPNLWSTRQFHLLLSYYNFLYADAMRTGHFEEAVQYQHGMQQAQDSIDGLEMQVRIARLNEHHKAESLSNQLEIQDQSLARKNLFILLLCSLLVMILLLGIIFFLINKQRQLSRIKKEEAAFTNALLQRIEEERKRIAADLHDDIGHKLLDLRNSHGHAIDENIKSIDNIIDTLRQISRNLHPVLFDSIGLKTSLEQLVLRTHTKEQFFLTSEIEYSGCLPHSIEIQLYRIIQEAVNNMTKHSGAAAGKIMIWEDTDEVVVEIIDNGRGFKVDEALQSKNSFGVHSILERGKHIGGKVAIRSSEKGTWLRIEIPKP
jgi:two-component system, NarL family, sensor kinase